MFFIEKGNVRLVNKENKLIKVLNSGEGFGEIALIRGRKRLNSEISIGDTILVVIKSEMISKLIEHMLSTQQIRQSVKSKCPGHEEFPYLVWFSNR